MMKKYEFTGETKMWLGRELHRIRAVRDFGDVKCGTLGGWIEKEDNLSHNGSCFVYGNARVYGNALVYDSADISKTEHYICIGPIGSRGDFTTFFKSKDGKIMVVCGCFYGDIDRFAEKVHGTHEGNKHEKVYLAACGLAKLQIEVK